MAAAERQAFYDRIAPANLAPLWEQLHSLVTPEPTTSCIPALWRYEPRSRQVAQCKTHRRDYAHQRRGQKDKHAVGEQRDSSDR